MQGSAVAHQEQRYAKILKRDTKAAEELKKEEEEELKGGDDRDAAFLSKLNKETYMGGNDALEDRVAKRAHYRQRGDMDEAGLV